MNVSLWFWLAFPKWRMICGMFLYNQWSFLYLLYKNVYSDPLPIKKIRLSFHYWVVFFMYSGEKSLTIYMICKYFFPYYRLSFQFLKYFLIQSFQLFRSNNLFFTLCCSAFGAVFKKILLNWNLWIFTFTPIFLV